MSDGYYLKQLLEKYKDKKICFKAVTEIKGSFYSFCYTEPHLRFCEGSNSNLNKRYVSYKVGEWTKPILEGTRLFVFKELEDAKDFVFSDFSIGKRIFIAEHSGELLKQEPIEKMDDLEHALISLNVWKETIEDKTKIKRPFSFGYGKSYTVESLRLLEMVSYQR